MARVRADRIHTARLRAGMTQADLAHALRGRGFKTNERSVRNWERGRDNGGNVPHADVVPAIAEATGVELSFLFAEDPAADDEDAALIDLRHLPEDLRRRIRPFVQRSRADDAAGVGR
jgi:transcriptional regulator with XRE-family HTH domain